MFIFGSFFVPKGTENRTSLSDRSPASVGPNKRHDAIGAPVSCEACDGYKSRACVTSSCVEPLFDATISPSISRSSTIGRGKPLSDTGQPDMILVMRATGLVLLIIFTSLGCTHARSDASSAGVVQQIAGSSTPDRSGHNVSELFVCAVLGVGMVVLCFFAWIINHHVRAFRRSLDEFAESDRAVDSVE